MTIHRFARATGSAVLVSAACLASAMAVAAPAGQRVVSVAMQQALQRDLGIGPGQLDRYVQIESQSMRKEAELRLSLGNRFAGAWLERDANGEFRQVVATTDALAARSIAGADLRLVRYSLATLEAVIAQLNKAQADAPRDLSIHSWHIDLPRNKVVVTTDPGVNAAAFVRRSGADPAAVSYRTSMHRPQPTAAPILGGNGYGTSDGYCSIGFSAYYNAPAFITAGHCGATGATVGSLDNLYIGFFGRSVFPIADMAWVYVGSSEWTRGPQVVNGNGLQNVYGGREAPVGAVVCRSGIRTGYRCGVITGKNYTAHYKAGVVYNMTLSNACSGAGDSGGSVITPGGEAQGVHSGSNAPDGGDNCSFTNPESIYQPLQPILNAHPGMTLDTVASCGRLNPGRNLVQGASLVSCDGRLSLDFMLSGQLILRKNFFNLLWSNNVAAGADRRLEMQADGNLVVYDASGAVWSSRTAGNNGAALFLQDDGNLVIYSYTGRALWSTRTAGN